MSIPGPGVGKPLGPGLSAGVEGRWQRLHPATPLVRAGPVVVGLVLVLASSHSTSRTSHAVDLALLLVGLAAGVVSWLVTRWRLGGEVLQIETGLLRRSSRRFPLAQVQAVEVVRPGLARLLGMAELRVRMGSGSGSTGRLAYMSADQAAALRAQLLEMMKASTASPKAPAPQQRPATVQAGAPPQPGAEPKQIFAVDPGRLVASVLLSGRMLVPVVVLAAVIVFGPGGARLAGALGPALLFAVAIWRRINAEMRLRLATSEEGLLLETGLVETTAELIPWGRVQALRMIEPLLWRPFGWCRLEADLAGRAISGRRNRAATRAAAALVPVGRHEDAARLVERMMAGAPRRLEPAPSRARWKAPLRYHNLSFGVSGGFVVTTSGRLRKVTDWVPLAKIQSIRRSEGPIQRRLGLASLHFDTAGRSVFAAARDRERAEVDRLLASLPEACRRARATQHRPGSASPTAATAPTTAPEPFEREA